MANRYFRNTGSTLWNVATNWSTTDGGGADAAVPTTNDNIFLTANSGSCALNVATTSLGSFNCTGYSGTLSGSSNLSITGDIILSPTMTITYTGLLNIAPAATSANMISNGQTWTGTLVLSGSTKTHNLLDNWTINNFTISTSQRTIIGGNIRVLGSYTNNAVATQGMLLASTSTITMIGTGTVTSSGATTDLIIDTTGTITFTGTTIIYRSFVYIKGTVITTGSILNLFVTTVNSPITVDFKSIVWNTIQYGNSITTTNLTITYLSGFTCANFIYGHTSTNTISMILVPGFTNRITTSFIAILTDGNTPTTKAIKSSIPGTRATLTLDAAATCSIGFYTFIDIDASAGRPINVFQGTVNNCLNVVPYNDPVITSAKSFVS